MTGQVGPRGLAILVLAGITGLLLAILGWSQRGTGLVAPTVGGLGGPAPARTTPARTATATVGPGATRSVDATLSPGATAQATPITTASLGPLLSSEPYASFAYLVWPGTMSAAARQAMSGLTITVTRQVGGIAVRAGAIGQPLLPARFYPEGGKVYVLESNLGDDSGDVDYNLGDDSLIVTTVQGQIVQ
jgi:hypothetical protein